MADPAAALTVQLLEWLTARPRTYAEVMDAWKTCCPRLSIWEDACTAGLIDRTALSSGQDSVRPSAAGLALLSALVAEGQARSP